MTDFSIRLNRQFGAPRLVIVRAPSPRFTRDGDAFGIGLMAWPPLKLDLTSSFRLLAIATADSQTHHLQLSASSFQGLLPISCSALLSRSALLLCCQIVPPFPTRADPSARRPDQASSSRGIPLLSPLVSVRWCYCHKL